MQLKSAHMSRGGIRSTTEICADCSAPDPSWSSINRGVFVCDECCSIHRSLGRHISQIRSLKKGSWSPNQLAMMIQLVTSANNIWEYLLMDPSPSPLQNKQRQRKPNPRDPVHPTKADFIRAKYQFLAFINKQRDSEVSSTDDLNKQLHSSVRTANLETSLRLLSLGADPNYFHPEKGSRPLHVASREGQIMQVELLVVYGADPGAVDLHGKTPIDHAREENHKDLGDRLVECQYELTDRLAFYLCGRKPDHRAGQDFIIPEMADSSLDLSELAKAAKKKLQLLPNHLFEELAMDVYDEVDRRENENIWLSGQGQTTVVSDRQTVPFLPVNPEFSSTRNQGRQKLARFNAREFATLIIDILNDAKRRQQGVLHNTSLHKDKDKHEFTRVVPTHRLPNASSSIISDDEPLYDSVASDEDYASIGDSERLDNKDVKPGPPLNQQSLASSDHSDTPITLEEYLEVKRGLVESETKIQQLLQANKDLKQQVILLDSMVHKLIQENELIRNGDMTPSDSGTGVTARREGSLEGRGPARPWTMYEPGDSQQRHKQHQQMKDAILDRKLEDSLGDENEAGGGKLQHQNTTSSGSSDYDNRVAKDMHVTLDEGDVEGGSSSRSSSGQSNASSQVTPTNSSAALPQDGATAGNPGLAPPGADSASGEDLAMPTQDEVIRKTERITKKIQDLLVAAQEGQQDRNSNTARADKIRVAVREMVALFPQNVQDERVQDSLLRLTRGAERLQEKCSQDPPQDADGRPDFRFHTQEVIQCAFDIAKAAKQIVVMFN